MIFEEPQKLGFTVYSKSNCVYCNKAKTLLTNKKLLLKIIECDEYILEDKLNFLSFITKLTNKEVNTFPMIFYDENFIGGFEELICFIDKHFLLFDDFN